MSKEAESDDSPSKLKRAIIDHMVITLVAGVVSAFFFLVWHLYSNLEKRVSEQERDSAAAILVLKEAVISYRVRLDMLEREPVRRAEVVAVPHATAPPVSTWTPPPQPPMVQQLKSIEALSTAREELQKQIQVQRPMKP